MKKHLLLSLIFIISSSLTDFGRINNTGPASSDLTPTRPLVLSTGGNTITSPLIDPC